MEINPFRLDGEESFTAAYGIERDGRTIVMFRRRIAGENFPL